MILYKNFDNKEDELGDLLKSRKEFVLEDILKALPSKK